MSFTPPSFPPSVPLPFSLSKINKHILWWVFKMFLKKKKTILLCLLPHSHLAYNSALPVIWHSHQLSRWKGSYPHLTLLATSLLEEPFLPSAALLFWWPPWPWMALFLCWWILRQGSFLRPCPWPLFNILNHLCHSQGSNYHQSAQGTKCTPSLDLYHQYI